MKEQGKTTNAAPEVKTDRRVMKTRKAIHNAFVELITARELSEITVKDIAELADINRKTFYNHYTDIDMLIDEMENEIILAFDRAMEGISIKNALTDPEDLCRRLLSIGYQCSDICAHLMNIRYNGELVDKICEALKASIMKSPNVELHVDDRTFDILLGFAVAGMLQAYQGWFNSDRSESIEDLTRRLSEVIVNGVHGIVAEINT